MFEIWFVQNNYVDYLKINKKDLGVRGPEFNSRSAPILFFFFYYMYMYMYNSSLYIIT